jgi:hypothetical protein
MLARSDRRENAAAEQVEVGAAEHLALEHLEPVDVPFDQPCAPEQCQAGHDAK